MTTFKQGEKVMCNGYEGTIHTVCDGQLEGMYEVKLSSGTVCVDGCDIEKAVVLFTNEGDCLTKLELSGRGVSKICTNLVGEHSYRLTEKAKAAIVGNYDCVYENGNGQLIEM